MTFLEAYRVRKRVIAALLQREAKKRFGNQGIGLLTAFFEPMVQVAFFGALFYAIDKQAPHGSHLMPFMISGVLTFHLFSKIMGRGMTAIDSNRTLLSYPIMQPIDPLVARTVLEAIIYVTTLIVLLVACVHLEMMAWPPRFEYVLFGLVAAVLMGAGLATFFAALLARYGAVKKVVPLINRAAFMTSGIFFSASMIPQFAREMFLWNPMLNIVEMVRYGLFQDYPAAHFSLGYVFTVVVVTMTLGVVALQHAQADPKARIRSSA
jgi:capsular polysaccharide transport system permease protein